MKRSSRGFTLVEVLVALMVVALALAALMNSVSSSARSSEHLRDKTEAQWIAMNRIAEVRLNVQKFGDSGDKGQIEFANRKWRYDTRYFDTDNPNIRRVVVRVWPAAAKADSGALAEAASFLVQGPSLARPGSANSLDWSAVAKTPSAGPGTGGNGGSNTSGNGGRNGTPRG